MNSVLAVYGTTEGQTRKIAEFVANAIGMQVSALTWSTVPPKRQ